MLKKQFNYSWGMLIDFDTRLYKDHYTKIKYNQGGRKFIILSTKEYSFISPRLLKARMNSILLIIESEK